MSEAKCKAQRKASHPVSANPLLRYYGGKWRLASWIISHFPEHVTYVEPYGGAGSVLFKKKPSRFEIYNDADKEVFNFFRVLRERSRALKTAIALTPYSRNEFEESYVMTGDEVELARKFFVRSWQGYGGPRFKRLTGWKSQSREWLSSRVDQVKEWNKSKTNLDLFVRRLQGVQLECEDALTLIKHYDTPQTLFYCDPPYPSTTRNRSWCKDGYTIEISGHHHTHLSNLLHRIEGYAVISTYPNEMYDELYADWRKVTKTSQTMNKTIATEVLYLSPRIHT